MSTRSAIGDKRPDTRSGARCAAACQHLEVCAPAMPAAMTPACCRQASRGPRPLRSRASAAPMRREIAPAGRGARDHLAARRVSRRRARAQHRLHPRDQASGAGGGEGRAWNHRSSTAALTAPTSPQSGPAAARCAPRIRGWQEDRERADADEALGYARGRAPRGPDTDHPAERDAGVGGRGRSRDGPEAPARRDRGRPISAAPSLAAVTAPCPRWS